MCPGMVVACPDCIFFFLSKVHFKQNPFYSFLLYGYPVINCSPFVERLGFFFSLLYEIH